MLTYILLTYFITYLYTYLLTYVVITYMRNIACIRLCLTLTQKAAVRPTVSLVILIIVYANGLLYDLTDLLVNKLQRVQSVTCVTGFTALGVTTNLDEDILFPHDF